MKLTPEQRRILGYMADGRTMMLAFHDPHALGLTEFLVHHGLASVVGEAETDEDGPALVLRQTDKGRAAHASGVIWGPNPQPLAELGALLAPPLRPRPGPA